uniref:cytochrome c oxidase subunit III n=1 Tax=Laemobothrion maximum TaxID=2337902 RepID=UPI00257AAD03|nr:cytochrome c oxidase subunit III [Laemobothrion maximum]WGU50339.1 cytochrome c oxidase subunit 3 [Laemobothrion maximum]
MMSKFINPFSVVSLSPWPLLMSMTLFNMFMSISFMLYKSSFYMLILTTLSIVWIILLWMRDLNRENMQGYFTHLIQKGFKLGMILFISSEIMFFLSIFWAYFYYYISPLELWPPMGIHTINPLKVPLLGTLILISSGVTLTISHYYLMKSKFIHMTTFLFLTIILGMIFTSLQISEFFDSSFTIADGIFGSLFFVSTGFHGMHVIFGSAMLSWIFMNFMIKSIATYFDICSFEIIAWYWHFVDVVWLFLYVMIYWGSK